MRPDHLDLEGVIDAVANSVPGGGAMRHLSGHPDVPGKLGRRARASVTAAHDAAAAAASFGERFGALTGAGAVR